MAYVLTFIGGLVSGAIMLRWIQAELGLRKKSNGRATARARTPKTNDQRMRANGWLPPRGKGNLVSFRQAAHRGRTLGVTAEQLDDMPAGITKEQAGTEY
jgi:hypothetical protein